MFDLSRCVELHLDSTAGTGELAVGGGTAGLLGLGEKVMWRARHLGVTQALTSRITRLDRPRCLRDSMVRGAFARFDHDHDFEAVDRGTSMADRFDDAAPLGILGRAAERLCLSRYLRRFLVARNLEIKRVAESPDAWRRYLESES